MKAYSSDSFHFSFWSNGLRQRTHSSAVAAREVASKKQALRSAAHIHAAREVRQFKIFPHANGFEVEWESMAVSNVLVGDEAYIQPEGTTEIGHVEIVSRSGRVGRRIRHAGPRPWAVQPDCEKEIRRYDL